MGRRCSAQAGESIILAFRLRRLTHNYFMIRLGKLGWALEARQNLKWCQHQAMPGNAFASFTGLFWDLCMAGISSFR